MEPAQRIERVGAGHRGGFKAGVHGLVEGAVAGLPRAMGLIAAGEPADGMADEAGAFEGDEFSEYG
jgi:hypothetical protein